MPERLELLRLQSTRLWQRLTTVQRIVTIGAVAAAVGLILALTSWARTPDWTVLYTSMSQEDAGAVVAKLKEMKVPFEVGEGGTIKVPSASVYELRLELASAGLPQSGVGYELFSQSNLGMTEFAQKVNYQRALEGELARTISRLDPVEAARVHVAIPQPTLYSDAEKATTASVVLKLKPGRKLDKTQIDGVSHLVAGSIEGLKAENLTIVDTSGNILSGAGSLGLGGSAGAARSASQLEIQRAYETTVERNLQGVLDQVLGQGRSAVRVSADLNWDQVETTTESYNPEGKPAQVRSAQESIERSSPAGAGQTAVGGSPGSDANLPTYQAVTTSTLAGYERRQTTSNYELSKVVEKTIKSPGAVRRLAVAVVLDDQSGSGQVALTQPQVDSVTGLVKAGAGLQDQRGDTVTVASIPFNRKDLEEARAAMDAQQQQETYLSYGRTAAMILGPILLLVFLRFMLRRPRYKVETVNVTPRSDGRVARVQGRAPQGELDFDEEELPKLLEQDPRRAGVRRQIAALAKENPATLAQLMETWLEEDKRN